MTIRMAALFVTREGVVLPIQLREDPSTFARLNCLANVGSTTSLYFVRATTSDSYQAFHSLAPCSFMTKKKSNKEMSRCTGASKRTTLNRTQGVVTEPIFQNHL